MNAREAEASAGQLDRHLTASQKDEIDRRITDMIFRIGVPSFEDTGTYLVVPIESFKILPFTEDYGSLPVAMWWWNEIEDGNLGGYDPDRECVYVNAKYVPRILATLPPVSSTAVAS